MRQNIVIIALMGLSFVVGVSVKQLYVPKNSVSGFVRVIGPCQVYPVDIERAIQSGGVIEEK